MDKKDETIDQLLTTNSMLAKKMERQYHELTTSEGLYQFLKGVVNYHVSQSCAPPMYKTEKTNDALTTIKIAYERLMRDYKKGE